MAYYTVRGRDNVVCVGTPDFANGVLTLLLKRHNREYDYLMLPN